MSSFNPSGGHMTGSEVTFPEDVRWKPSEGEDEEVVSYKKRYHRMFYLLTVEVDKYLDYLKSGMIPTPIKENIHMLVQLTRDEEERLRLVCGERGIDVEEEIKSLDALVLGHFRDEEVTLKVYELLYR